MITARLLFVGIVLFATTAESQYDSVTRAEQAAARSEDAARRAEAAAARIDYHYLKKLMAYVEQQRSYVEEQAKAVRSLSDRANKDAQLAEAAAARARATIEIIEQASARCQAAAQGSQGASPATANDATAINLRWCKDNDGANDKPLIVEGAGGCTWAAVSGISSLGVAAGVARRRDVITAAKVLALSGNCDVAATGAAVCQCHNADAAASILSNPGHTCELLKSM